MTILIPRTATISVGGDAMDIAEGTVTLDETTTYCVADVTLALDDDSDGIDPRTGVRGVITASVQGGTPRSFDLGVRSRTIDHEGKTVRLRLASDEELVNDFAPLADITTALDHQDSLYDIIDGVLGEVIPGAALEAGTDLEFPVSWDSANLIDNPGAETGVHGMSVNDVSVAQSNLWAASETYSFLLFGPTSADSYGYMNLFSLGAMRDRTYTASASAFINTPLSGSSSALRRSIAVIITTSTGPVIYASERADNSGGVVSRLAVRFRIPANALDVALFFYHGHTVGNMWWDDLRLSEGDGIRDRDIGRLDGAQADDDLYEYEWDDTPGNSTSRRTAINPVPAETLVWPVGVSGWDFLLPITSAAGRRLFCDEQRKWRLVDENYTIPGVIVASAQFTRSGDDSISRDGNLWADGVVARYTWKDDFDAIQVKEDAAGTEGKVLVVEFDRPYPGPGAAASILLRMSGQGRTQTASRITDYAATPGMQGNISLPGTEDQVGRLTGVQFDLNIAYMDIATRGLTSIVPGSIAWLTGTINSLAGTIDGL